MPICRYVPARHQSHAVSFSMTTGLVASSSNTSVLPTEDVENSIFMNAATRTDELSKARGAVFHLPLR